MLVHAHLVFCLGRQQQQVGLACRQQPSAILCALQMQDRVTQAWELAVGILSHLVEQPNLASAGRNCEPSLTVDCYLVELGVVRRVAFHVD